MDEWGPARVSGQSRERYFLLVVDDYTRYTTVFLLRSKGQVVGVLIPWIRTGRLQLRERLGQDLPVLCLHPVRGGDFSSNLLRKFCCGEGILQSFTLPDSPQQNGIAECRIGLVMEVARTSMIHAAAPHFRWPFVVRYVAHQLNLWPRVSLPETSPRRRWTGEVGDTSADKLSARAIPCIFLGFVPNAPGWVLLRAARGAACGGAEPGGAGFEGVGSWGAEPEGVEPEGVEPGGAESECAESGGAEPRGAALVGGPVGASPRLSPQQLREWLVQRACLRSGAPGDGGTGDAGAGGAEVSAGAGGTGAAGTGGVGGAGAGDPMEPGAAGAGGSCTGGAGAGGAGATGVGAVDPGAGGTVRPRLYFVPLLQQPASPLPAPSPYTEQSGGLTECREPASRLVSLVCTAHRAPRSRPPPVPGTHTMALRPSSVPLRVPLPSPPESSLPEVPDPESDCARAASPTVSRLLATAVTDPSFESAAASALVADLLDFAAACGLDYATALVAEYASASPPCIGGECALGTDVLEDTQKDFECLAATLPHFASMLLASEGDPDAPDIPFIFCRRTSAGTTRVVVLPTKLLRRMELQAAAEEEEEGEAEAVGEALAEGEAVLTTMRGMGALVAGGAPEWRVRVGSGAQGDGAHGEANPGMFRMVEDVKGSNGCTSHMTPRADLLDEVKPPRKIKFVPATSCALLPVMGVWNAKMMVANGGLVGLGNVLLVEGLSANLLSGRRLQKSKAKVTFDPTSCREKLGKLLLWNLEEKSICIKELWHLPIIPWNGKLPATAAAAATAKANAGGEEIAPTDGALDAIKKVQQPQQPHGEVLAGVDATATWAKASSGSGEADWETWHGRVCHVNFSMLQKLVKDGSLKGLEVKGAAKEIGSCPTCLETKFTKFPFSSGMEPAKAPLALVHMDVVGPTRAPSLSGSCYFLTIVDDHTRAVWVYPLQTKGESGHKVKVICIDNGGEFIGADFEAVLKKKGIQHQLTVPYNPQQNGVAERFNQILNEGARTHLGRAGLPDPFWVTALWQVALVKNRVLATVGDKQWVPYTKWYGSAPAVNMLRAYGCMVVFHVQRPSRQVQVIVSDEEISGVTEDGGEPEVEEQQQQQQQQQ
ncbi:unnamed protein product [Closterium sp. NIES-54]